MRPQQWASRAQRRLGAVLTVVLAVFTELKVSEAGFVSSGVLLSPSSLHLFQSGRESSFTVTGARGGVQAHSCRISQHHRITKGTTMILDRMDVLKAASIILASQSPRRVEILNEIVGLNVRAIPSTFEEDLDKSKFTPATYVQETARHKALEVWKKLVEQGESPDLVIGGDTVVALDDKILEKPDDKAHAEKMLGELSGHTHSVFSGVVLLYPGKDGEMEEKKFTEETRVTFAELSPAAITAYVESGEPFDKAGGLGLAVQKTWLGLTLCLPGGRYGIQAKGGMFVSGINGCYYNVMGFPMHRFCVELGALMDEGLLFADGPRKAAKTK